MKNLKTLATVFLSGILLLTVACSTSDPATTPPTTTTSVTAQTTAVSTTGFTLSFDVAVPELTADNFVMTPKVTSVTPDASNKIYTVVTSALAAGSSFTVSFKKDGYTFSPETLTINVPNAGDVAITAKVSGITTNGFTMTFDKAVADFAASNIKLDNSAAVTSITAVGTDNKVFTVVSTLTAGTTYNATLTKTGFSFIPQPLQIIVPAPAVVAITASVSNPSTTGFTLTFDKAIAGFAKTDITLAPAATITSVTAVPESGNTVFTVVTGQLMGSTAYTVTLTKTGYAFSGTPTFTSPPTPVVVSIPQFNTSGFTLSFDVAVAGLAKADVAIGGGATITDVTAVSGTSNKEYKVVTSALTDNSSYTVTITKATFAFTGTFTFTPLTPPAIYFDASTAVPSLADGGTATWTAPAGVTKVYAVVVGGGGGGAIVGGGGGGYVRQGNITVIPGTTYNIAVGAGGIGVAGPQAGTGGITSIKSGNTTLIYAQGGKGGEGYSIPSRGGAGSSGGGAIAGNGGSNCGATPPTGLADFSTVGVSNNSLSSDDWGGVYAEPIVANCTDPVSNLSYGGGGSGTDGTATIGNIGHGGGHTGGIYNGSGSIHGVANTGGGGGSGVSNGNNIINNGGDGGSGTVLIYPARP